MLYGFHTLKIFGIFSFMVDSEIRAKLLNSSKMLRLSENHDFISEKSKINIPVCVCPNLIQPVSVTIC